MFSNLMRITFSKSFGFNEKQCYLGKYFMENSLIDYKMIKYSPSVIAVSCSYIVMKFFGISNYKKLYSTSIIHEKCSQKIIKDTARELCFLVKNLNSLEFKSIKEKYLGLVAFLHLELLNYLEHLRFHEK